MAAPAGALGSSAEAAQKTLPKLRGLRLGASTVERVTERVGADVGARLAEGETFGGRSGGRGRGTRGESCGYVSADLTGVGGQGLGGARAEGRMAAMGRTWNAGEEGRVRHGCGLTGGLTGLGASLRRPGARVGRDRAEGWVAIAGGGAGIEGGLRENFPRVEAVVLGSSPAAGHPGDWAKALHPDCAAEAVGRRVRGATGGSARAGRRGWRTCGRSTCRGGRLRPGERAGGWGRTSRTRSTGWTTRPTGPAAG